MRSPLCLFIPIIFVRKYPHYGPGFNSASTEMSTRNTTGGKGLPVHKADNLTAICEPIF
jgi:hypothetical protein